MSDKRIDPPATKHRTLNNKLHQLALLSPAKFAAVEAFVDEALAEASAAQAVPAHGTSNIDKP